MASLFFEKKLKKKFAGVIYYAYLCINKRKQI